MRQENFLSRLNRKMSRQSCNLRPCPRRPNDITRTRSRPSRAAKWDFTSQTPKMTSFEIFSRDSSIREISREINFSEISREIFPGKFPEKSRNCVAQRNSEIPGNPGKIPENSRKLRDFPGFSEKSRKFWKNPGKNLGKFLINFRKFWPLILAF